MCTVCVGGSQPRPPPLLPLIRCSLSAHLSSFVFSLCRLPLPRVSAFPRKTRPVQIPSARAAAELVPRGLSGAGRGGVSENLG